jgi:1-acyl-sn-glycerol-3-phosphate acyltransferase
MSKIMIENHVDVYEHFREFKPKHKKFIQRWAALTNLIYKARITYAKGARKDLEVIRDKDYPHIYVLNHRGNWDGYIFLSVFYQIARYDLGNIRGLVTVLCFENIFMSRIYRGAGLIPVFLKTHLVKARHHRSHPERLQLVSAANESMFNCLTYIQTKHRQKIFIYPEGTFNKGAPDTLLPVRKGAAEIARRVARADEPVAITTIGVAYSKKNQRIINPRRASVFVGRPIFVEPSMTTEEITDLIRVRLLSSVKKAVTLY